MDAVLTKLDWLRLVLQTVHGDFVFLKWAGSECCTNVQTMLKLKSDTNVQTMLKCKSGHQTQTISKSILHFIFIFHL